MPFEESLHGLKRQCVLDRGVVSTKIFINDQGNRIASTVSKNLVIWSSPDGKPMRKLEYGYRTNIDLSKDGERLLVSSPTKREMLVVPMIR